eukprot:TRINITY_DN24529_c0_g1_i1.p1 TRINITY_DN24529_c0_g1~~TRINITY_DN24529_c0_g1_i1.p1  ORF type:complete len:485 (+),score=75.96 TRINITY_DN24529_c0_g1_i1:50-1456(+)
MATESSLPRDPLSFEVETESTSSCSSRSSNFGSAIALRAAGINRVSTGAPAEAPEGRKRRLTVFGMGLVLTSTMGGGLIFGCSPFQDSLVKHYGYTTSDAEQIFGSGFQIFVLGTALLAPLLDFVGPRWFAAAGLCMEFWGHRRISFIESYDVNQGTAILTVAYGLIGLGGNMVMLGSMNFCDLFANSGMAASMIGGGFQAAGFMFMLLTLESVDLATFFTAYQSIAILGLATVLLCFPDAAYTSPDQVPRFLHFPSLPRCSGSERRESPVHSHSGLRHFLSPLFLWRTWGFLFCFSWAATCAAWCAGAFLGAVTRKAGNPPLDPSTLRLQSNLIALQPAISNATFFISPCIGALVDARGFAAPIVCQTLSVILCVLCMWLLPLEGQWLTLISLNILQAFTYTIQLAYIAGKYPTDQFGLVMSLSTLVQAAVNPLGIMLLQRAADQAAAAFALPSVLLGVLWLAAEVR